MPNLLRNVLAVIIGFAVGSAVNMAIITIGSSVVPAPDGVDVTNVESLRENMHLFEPRHYLVPFLAHALGTFVGALAAYLIAGSPKGRIALAVGALFLLGGIAASFMIPAPAWFIALDLVLAYLPMAWLACRIGAHFGRGQAVAA
jgi:hypothetical protein